MTNICRPLFHIGCHLRVVSNEKYILSLLLHVGQKWKLSSLVTLSISILWIQTIPKISVITSCCMWGAQFTHGALVFKCLTLISFIISSSSVGIFC